MVIFRGDEENNGDLEDGGNYWENYRARLESHAKYLSPAVKELLEELGGVGEGRVEVPDDLVEEFETFICLVEGWDEDGAIFAPKPIIKDDPADWVTVW